MTGGEIVGAIGAAAKKAVGEDPAVKAALIEAAKETDEFARAGEVLAARTTRRQAAFYQVCRPLYALIGVRKDYFEKHFEDDLAEKTKAIPEENLRTPAGSVAGPALEGLSWSLDEAELKDMYLNLLATAADDRRSDAHPAFAHAIRQLGPDEAETLQVVLMEPTESVVIVSIQFHFTASETRAAGYIDGHRHILPMTEQDGTPVDQAQMTAWIENWERLGLVETNYLASRTTVPGGPDPYEWADGDASVITARASCESDPSREVRLERGLLQITETGRRFARTVFAWPQPPISEPPQ